MLADRPLNISIRRPKFDPAIFFQNVFTRKVNELAIITGQLIEKEVRHQISSKRLVATSELLNSITTSIADAQSGKLMRVGSNTIQARVMETGSRPQGSSSMFGSRWASGKPTHQKDSGFMGRIQIWMGKKGISGGRGSAFRIARSIALRGIPSSPTFPLRHPFRNAQRNVRRAVYKLWQVELGKALARINKSNA